MVVINYAVEDIVPASATSPYRGAATTIRTPGIDLAKFDKAPVDYGVLASQSDRLFAAWRQNALLLIVLAAPSSRDSRRGALSRRFMCVPAELDVAEALLEVVEDERLLEFEAYEGGSSALPRTPRVVGAASLVPTIYDRHDLVIRSTAADVLAVFLRCAVRLSPHAVLSVLTGSLGAVPRGWNESSLDELLNLGGGGDKQTHSAAAPAQPVSNLSTPRAVPPALVPVASDNDAVRPTSHLGAFPVELREFDGYGKLLNALQEGRLSASERSRVENHRQLMRANQYLAQSLLARRTTDAEAVRLAIWFDMWSAYLRYRLQAASKTDLEQLFATFVQRDPFAVLVGLPLFVRFMSSVTDEKHARAVAMFIQLLVPHLMLQLRDIDCSA